MWMGEKMQGFGIPLCGLSFEIVALSVTVREAVEMRKALALLLICPDPSWLCPPLTLRFSSASSPPALVCSGPFCGFVYKNVTVPVYTALKGVRNHCVKRWGGPVRRDTVSACAAWGGLERPRERSARHCFLLFIILGVQILHLQKFESV